MVLLPLGVLAQPSDYSMAAKPLKTGVALQNEGLFRQLNRHLSGYQRRVKDLIQSRGYARAWYQQKVVNNQILVDALHDYDPTHQTALLFYHTEADTLFYYLLSGYGIIATHKQPKPSLKSLSNALTATKLPSRGGKIDATDSQADPQMLAGQLIPPPIASVLQSFNYLLIVPEQGLGGMPFATLQPFGNEVQLIDRLSLSIVPSLDELLTKIYFYRYGLELRDSKKGIFDPIEPLIIGAPDYTLSCTSRLSPLPQTAREAIEIADLLGSKPLLGSEATRLEIENRLAKADFIHFATHGFASTSQSLDSSYLALTSTKTECGLWSARSIQQQKLSGDALVVLSACETGQGQLHEGGIIGLARAFQLAGASNVVMSLWAVPDGPTADFMIGFTKELFNPSGFFPAGQLRKTILAQKAQSGDSRAWAAFVNFGVPYPPGVQMKMK